MTALVLRFMAASSSSAVSSRVSGQISANRGVAPDRTTASAQAEWLREAAIRAEFREQYRAAETPRQLRGLNGLHDGEPVRAVGQRPGAGCDALDEVPVLHSERLVR